MRARIRIGVLSILAGLALWFSSGFEVIALERGVWEARYQDERLMISTSDPHAIVVTGDKAFAAVDFGKDTALAAIGFFQTPFTADKLVSTLTMGDGRAMTRTMSHAQKQFAVHSEDGVVGYVYLFRIGDTDLELLKAARTWTIEADNVKKTFPMTGSRKAIQKAQDLAKARGELSEEDIARIRRQEQEEQKDDCIRLAGHPWDENTGGAGVTWDALDAEAAMQACDRALGYDSGDRQVIYLMGRALDKAGDKDAILALKLASSMGYAPATYHLGLLYWDASYDLDDKARGRQLFEKAAQSGYLPARNQLALAMIESGNGDQHVLGMRMLQASADSGYTNSQREFAEFLQSGEAQGNPNPRMAMQYYEMAAQGDDKASAYRLAVMHRDGLGDEPNPALYLKYLRQAAKLGHKKAKAELGVE